MSDKKPSAAAMRAGAKMWEVPIFMPTEQRAAIIDAEFAPVVEALRDIMKLVEAGVLVRDISHDAETGWALHQLPLLLTLKAAQQALADLESK